MNNKEQMNAADQVNDPKFTVDLSGTGLKKSLDVLFLKDVTDPMVCVEVGCFEGQGSITLCKTLCKHPNSKVLCIDPFDDEYVKGSAEMSFWNHACKGQHSRFMHNTSGYPIEVMQGMSQDKIPQLLDASIDFAYIDGDHRPEEVYKDAMCMFPKMKQGGIILFDDYLWVVNGIHTKPGIDKFIASMGNKIEVIFRDYQLALRVL